MRFVIASLTVVCVVVSGAPSLSAAPAPADARKAFQDQYGSDLIKVRATREVTDDLELAKKMIDAAKAPDASAEMAGRLCDNAFTLASRDASGLETATAAMEALVIKAPAAAGPNRQKVIGFYQRELGKAKGDDKAKLTDALLDLLARYADASIQVGDFVQARTHLSTAERTAKQAKSPRESDLTARLEDLSTLERVAKDIDKWKVKLKENPSDAEAHKELFKLHLITMDDPRAAIPYLELGGDADDKRLAALATKPLDEVENTQLLDLGKWYQQVAGRAAPEHKAAMFDRAERYLHWFLIKYRVDDEARTDAIKSRKALKASIDEFAKTPVGKRTRTPWLDVLKLLDPKMKSPWWNWEGKNLVGSLIGGGPGIALPVVPRGSYKLRLTFVYTVEPKDDHVGTYVVLPCNSGKCRVSFSPSREQASIESEEVSVRTPLKIEPGRKYSVDIAVLQRDGQVEIAVDLDDLPCLHWSGKQSSLLIDPKSREWPASERESPCFILHSSNDKYTYDSIQLQMLDGEAKLMK